MFIALVLIVCVVFVSTGDAQSSCTTPNGEKGQCIEFLECQAFTDIWRNRMSKNIVFFRASKCGWKGFDPLVCCGSVAEFTTIDPLNNISTTQTIIPPIKITPRTKQTNVKNLLTITTSTPSEIPQTTELFTSPPVFTSRKNLISSTPSSRYASHLNAYLIPQRGKCGQQNFNTDRIFGGNETAIDEYPWLALLKYKYNNKETFECGGSLINERYVLTAAHCVAGKNLIKVRLGEYNLSQNPDCVDYDGYDDCALPFEEFDIEEKIVFDFFALSDRNRWDDIALIRLDRNVTYTDFIKPICLPMNDERSSPRDMLTVAGWGLTELEEKSKIKLHVQVPMWSKIGCNEIYSIGYKVNLTEKQFCAGGEFGKDSCEGDSGGPLMKIYPGALDYYMEGIVSFGSLPCGKTATPGVYVRVSEYIEWILDNMKPF